MSDINKVTLSGTIAAPPNLYMGASSTVFKFRVAIVEQLRGRGGESRERTEWVNCLVWGQLGENLARDMVQGSRVECQGRISSSSYEKDGQKIYKTEVVCDDVKLLAETPPVDPVGTRGSTAQPRAVVGRTPATLPKRPDPAPRNGDDYGTADPGEDDIPF